ncbi:MAG TPA: HAD family hydrolase [Acidimicrobiales bacterium]|nr:HAD family hydrolase [Acidimicrobiales bacterium]
MVEPVEAVIFDWGGTLSHWVPQAQVPEFWRAAAAAIDPARIDDLAAALMRAEHDVWAQIRGAQRSGRIEDIFAAAMAEHDVELAEAEFQLAAGKYFEAWELELRHKDDAVPMLAALKGMGLKTALLSNTHWPRSFHEELLERDGLAEFIDERVYSSELTHVKPHPIAFRTTLRALDVRPARAVFVGDRRYDDVFGAQSAGMRAVLVVPGPEDDDYVVNPDATIESLAELVAVIDGWLHPSRR